MRRPRLCLAALAALAIAPASATAAAPHTFEVVARQGQEARAISSIHRLGGQVTLRRGSTLQVRLKLAQLKKVRASAGVRGAGPVSVGWADAYYSQGIYRTGADVLQAQGLRGDGVRIAVLDLGFGTRWRAKIGTELPPAAGIDAVQSFDKTTGQTEIAGLSSSDTPTSHGESVAEVVHDMAPNAHLTLVNYHTELEFDQAVDWLMHGPDGKPRVDIVVHSNSFLDGPFDGTGETAQTVDAARAAGILWVNSAGNYGQRHWTGTAGRPRRRHLRRHDRSERPHVLDPRERRHGRVDAVGELHRRPEAGRRTHRLLRARHHAGRRATASCRSPRGCATRRGRSRSSPGPPPPPDATSCARGS